MIDNIYEWLYDHYYTPHAEEILRSYQSLSPSVQDAEQLLNQVQEAYPDCEVDLHFGGQPVYYYIVSLE